MLLRSVDVSRPWELFVHGGPGSPTLPFSHAFDGPLLETFSVVHWDQRGAGASQHADPNFALSLDGIAADGLELISTLRALVLVGTVVDFVQAQHHGVAFLEERGASPESLAELGEPPFDTVERVLRFSGLLAGHGGVLPERTLEALNRAAEQSPEYSEAQWRAQQEGARRSVQELLPFLLDYRASDQTASFDTIRRSFSFRVRVTR